MALIHVILVACAFLAAAEVSGKPECTADQKYQYDDLVNKTRTLELNAVCTSNARSVADVVKDKYTCNDEGLQGLSKSYEVLNSVESYLRNTNEPLKLEVHKCLVYLRSGTTGHCYNKTLGLSINATGEDILRCNMTGIFLENGPINAQDPQRNAMCAAHEVLEKCIVEQMQKEPEKCSPKTVEYMKILFKIPRDILCSGSNSTISSLLTSYKSAGAVSSLSFVTSFITLLLLT